MPQAFLEAPFCFGQGIWDFTPEATARATGGGGELPVSFDPTPPHTDDMPNPFLHRRLAGYVLGLEVNYPWAHEFFGSNSLVLDFEESCPKELKVRLIPEEVRPQLPPRTPLTDELAEAATQATVEALVKTCPSGGGSTPESVEVKLEVTEPTAGSGDAGGHDPGHNGPRPKGTLKKPFEQGGLSSESCTVTNFDADGMGACTLTYHPRVVSGVETIEATAPGFSKAEAKITVEVPGLVALPEDPGTYVLVGAPDNHAGTNDPCRPNPPTSRHPQNHFGRPRLNAAVLAIAKRMLQATGIKLRVNDVSLPRGGLFDFQNNWAPPHTGHRIGLAADIGFTGVRNGVWTQYDPDRLEAVIQDKTKNDPVVEDGGQPHFHAFVR